MNISNDLQPRRAEPAEDLLDLLPRRRLGIPQLILHPKPFPFEAAELMERQHVHALDVAQPRREVRHSSDLAQVVRPAGHDYETDPDGPTPGGEAARELMHGLVVLAGEPLVNVGRDGLEAEHNQI